MMVLHEGRGTGLHSEYNKDKWGLIARIWGGSVDRKLLRKHSKARGILARPKRILAEGRHVPKLGDIQGGLKNLIRKQR